jgi:hypothetical protein
MNQADQYLAAARRLHKYLVQTLWTGSALVGPDPGIRFNTRVGRFVKSYLSWLPWSDNLTYLQGQGYWVFSNWQMLEMTGDEQARSIAIDCSDNIIRMQKPEGYWEYPNPEWKDRIATVEGCFAAMGLLETYARHPEQKYLDAAIRWYHYLLSDIGFRNQNQDNMWAINYFAHRPGDGGGVPNNSTLLLWLLAKLFEATNDSQYLMPCEKMVAWLRHVQLPSGELPYALGTTAAEDRTHFLCFQYNAFEFMDLVYYHKITGDSEIWPVVERLAVYLSEGLTGDGRARFDCHHEIPEVPYYTIAISRALSMASRLGLGDFGEIAERGFAQVLSHQRPDGGFQYHSRRNYGCLTDRRSYPRYLSMMCNHLLLESRSRQTAAASAKKQLDGANT